MNQLVEKFLQDTIFPELEKGRPRFEKPHTIAVVQKAKDIIREIPQTPVDSDVIVIAAYAHDWGYAGLFQGGIIVDYDDITKVKPLHMEIGAQKIEALLKDNVFAFLSSAQKDRIIHLVRIHDNLDGLADPDELILMEADTLGAIDIEAVKPTFDAPSNEKYMNGVLKKRVAMFMTEYGKREAERLIALRNEYYLHPAPK